MKQLFVDTAGWMAMADAKDPMNTSFRTARTKRPTLFLYRLHELCPHEGIAY